MIADNWTQCPKCDEKRAADIAKAEKDVESLYGKVSAAEYQAALASVEKKRTAPAQETLREDYEIGIVEGEFSVSYGASCEVCGWGFEYTHSQAVP